MKQFENSLQKIRQSASRLSKKSNEESKNLAETASITEYDNYAKIDSENSIEAYMENQSNRMASNSKILCENYKKEDCIAISSKNSSSGGFINPFWTKEKKQEKKLDDLLKVKKDPSCSPKKSQQKSPEHSLKNRFNSTNNDQSQKSDISEISNNEIKGISLTKSKLISCRSREKNKKSRYSKMKSFHASIEEKINRHKKAYGNPMHIIKLGESKKSTSKENIPNKLPIEKISVNEKFNNKKTVKFNLTADSKKFNLKADSKKFNLTADQFYVDSSKLKRFMPYNKMNATEFKNLIKKQEKNILGIMEHEMYVNQFTFRNGKSTRDK